MSRFQPNHPLINLGNGARPQRLSPSRMPSSFQNRSTCKLNATYLSQTGSFSAKSSISPRQTSGREASGGDVAEMRLFTLAQTTMATSAKGESKSTPARSARSRPLTTWKTERCTIETMRNATNPSSFDGRTIEGYAIFSCEMHNRSNAGPVRGRNPTKERKPSRQPGMKHGASCL